MKRPNVRNAVDPALAAHRRHGPCIDIILAGHKVDAEEAYRTGLCERAMSRGQARQAAQALALEIARFPKGAMRTDRRAAYRQHGLSARAAMEQQWANGAETLAEANSGAVQAFARGKGRQGAIDDIWNFSGDLS